MFLFIILRLQDIISAVEEVGFSAEEINATQSLNNISTVTLNIFF
jgi:hypothetical protein